MKVIEFPEFGFTLKFDPESSCGSVKRTDHDYLNSNRIFQRNGTSAQLEGDLEEICLDSTNSGIESLVLAHACAGIDVQDPKYVEGIRKALEACADEWH